MRQVAATLEGIRDTPVPARNRLGRVDQKSFEPPRGAFFFGSNLVPICKPHESRRFRLKSRPRHRLNSWSSLRLRLRLRRLPISIISSRHCFDSGFPDWNLRKPHESRRSRLKSRPRRMALEVIHVDRSLSFFAGVDAIPGIAAVHTTRLAARRWHGCHRLHSLFA